MSGPGPALVRGGEGHGKSTLLRLLAGALPAGGGCLVLRGTGLAEAPQAYRQQVFWEDPRSNAIDALTVRAWLQSLPALHPAWDAPALTTMCRDSAWSRTSTRPSTCCPPAAGARC